MCDRSAQSVILENTTDQAGRVRSTIDANSSSQKKKMSNINGTWLNNTQEHFPASLLIKLSCLSSQFLFLATNRETWGTCDTAFRGLNVTDISEQHSQASLVEIAR